MPTTRICLDCNHLYTPPTNGQTTHSRCPNCHPNYIRNRPRGKHHNTPKRQHLNRFYSTHAWRTARHNTITRDGQCTQCGTTNRLHVHHIQSITDAPELALDPTNLTTLCATCHAHQGNTKRRHDARTRET